MTCIVEKAVRVRLTAPSQLLADEFGFSGDRYTCDDPANADLILVIDRRLGLPISLSILYVAAARRLGWTAEILNLPGHVLVMLGHEAAPVVVDPFRGGVRVDMEEIAALLASKTEEVSVPVRHVATMPNRAVLVRLVLNQATRAEAAGRGRRALTLYGRMTALAPDHPHAWWELARLELVDGDMSAARAVLRRCSRSRANRDCGNASPASWRHSREADLRIGSAQVAASAHIRVGVDRPT